MKCSLLLFGLFLSTFIYSQETDCNGLEGHFEIGDTWTYETRENLSGGGHNIDFRSVTIVDTLKHNGNTVFINDDGSEFYISESKMYFWDDILEEYIMYFDFISPDDYTIRISCPGSDRIDSMKVIVDSIYTVAINDTNIKVRKLNFSSFNDAWLERTVVVYDYIGAIDFVNGDFVKDGPCSIYDSSNRDFIIDLRCFKSSSCSINFKDYPCDSTYTITEVEDLLLNGVDIYPNPTTRMLNVDLEKSFDGEIGLFSLDGKRVFHQQVDNARNLSLDLSDVDTGIYVFRIGTEDGVFTKKVMVGR